MLEDELEDELDRLIDESSVKAVILAISEVCATKAERVRGSWQDTARMWDKAADLLVKTSVKVRV